MNEKLSNLAQILSGYSFRGAINPEKDGQFNVVQVRDIEAGCLIDVSNLVAVNTDKKIGSCFLRNGDVLLSVRGTNKSKLKVGLFKGNKNNVLASSSLLILRVMDRAKVLPEYLLCYFNSRLGQRILKGIMSGEVIRTILKKDIREIEIHIPDLETQQLIVGMCENNQVQQKLLSEKKVLINQIVEGSISKLLK